MKDVLRTNDPAELALARAALAAADIPAFELDVHMSALEGSIGALPRRIAVADRDAWRARHVLAEVGLLPRPGAAGGR